MAAATDGPVALVFLGVLPGTVLLALLALLLGGTGLKRLHLVLAAAGATAALWALAAARPLAGVDALRGPLALALARLALPAAWAPEVEFGILAAPFAFLVALGCYALATVGRNLYVFNDCEEASEELTRVRCAWRRREARVPARAHSNPSQLPHHAPCRTWRPRSASSRQRGSRPARLVGRGNL
jgi:hypothetical protein